MVTLTWEPSNLVLGHWWPHQRGNSHSDAHLGSGRAGSICWRQIKSTCACLSSPLSGAHRSNAHTDAQSQSTGKCHVSPSAIRDLLPDSCFMSFQGFALKWPVLKGLSLPLAISEIQWHTTAFCMFPTQSSLLQPDLLKAIHML